MFVLGEDSFRPVTDWTPDLGEVISWQPSPRSLDKIRQAPVSAVPASHQQARHLRNFRDHARRGADMSRLCIGSWDMPGTCDTRVMTYVLNAHLRRHDAYHSWFEFGDADDIVRHKVSDPNDIHVVPVKHGEMTPQAWQEYILTTPSPLQWDCFRFAIIQRADHFTFCCSIDHIYLDVQFIGPIYTELFSQYQTLVAGEAPIALPATGSYDDYCVRQHEQTSALTLHSPQVRAWIDFFEQNDGSLPPCPVSLGDGSGSFEVRIEQVMNEQQTSAFESACIAAGARFSGGVFSCAALAQYELTGAGTYHGLIATDTRSTPMDYKTMGWYAGFAPITVPVGGKSFGDIVRAAQKSFDAGGELSRVPFNYIPELAPWLRLSQNRIPLLFHVDASKPPLSTVVKLKSQLNINAYHDGGVPARFDLRVTRFEHETLLAVFYPGNPVARESVTRYIETLKSVYHRIADDRSEASSRRNGLRSVVDLADRSNEDQRQTAGQAWSARPA